MLALLPPESIETSPFPTLLLVSSVPLEQRGGWARPSALGRFGRPVTGCAGRVARLGKACRSKRARRGNVQPGPVPVESEEGSDGGARWLAAVTQSPTPPDMATAKSALAVTVPPRTLRACTSRRSQPSLPSPPIPSTHARRASSQAGIRLCPGCLVCSHGGAVSWCGGGRGERGSQRERGEREGGRERRCGGGGAVLRPLGGLLLVTTHSLSLPSLFLSTPSSRCCGILAPTHPSRGIEDAAAGRPACPAQPSPGSCLPPSDACSVWRPWSRWSGGLSCFPGSHLSSLPQQARISKVNNYPGCAPNLFPLLLHSCSSHPIPLRFQTLSAARQAYCKASIILILLTYLLPPANLASSPPPVLALYTPSIYSPRLAPPLGYLPPVSDQITSSITSLSSLTRI